MDPEYGKVVEVFLLAGVTLMASLSIIITAVCIWKISQLLNRMDDWFSQIESDLKKR